MNLAMLNARRRSLPKTWKRGKSWAIGKKSVSNLGQMGKTKSLQGGGRKVKDDREIELKL